MTAGEVYDRWRPAIDVIGWPEWEDEGVRYRLYYDSHAIRHVWTFQEWTEYQGGKSWVTIKTALVAPHVAACVLRDHARRWLAEREVEVRRAPKGGYYVNGSAFRLYEDLQDDYDTVLIEAVVAEGKDEGSNRSK